MGCCPSLGLGLPAVENKEVGFSNLAFLGPSVWSSHFNPPSSGGSRSQAPATDARGGRSRLGGWGRLGWELAGAAGPQMTSETQLDLPRQRRKRGEGSPTQAPQKKGDRLRFLEQSFLEQRQEEAAEIPLDLSAPKTSQEWPLFRSRKIC